MTELFIKPDDAIKMKNQSLCETVVRAGFLFDESDILFFDFFLPGAADGKLPAVIQCEGAVRQAVNVFQIHKDAEMDAAEPFPIQAWEQVGKILVDI